MAKLPTTKPTDPTPPPQAEAPEVDSPEALRAAVAAVGVPPPRPAATAPAPAPAALPAGVEFHHDRDQRQEQAKTAWLTNYAFDLLVHPDQWELRKTSAGWVVVPEVRRLSHQAGVSLVDTFRDPQGRQHANPEPARAAKRQQGYVVLPRDAGLAPGQSYCLVHRDASGRVLGYSEPWDRAGLGDQAVRDESAYVRWAQSLVGRYIPAPSQDHLEALRATVARQLGIYSVDERRPAHKSIAAGKLAAVDKALEAAHG